MPTKGLKSEIRIRAEELLKDFAPAQVAKNLFAESGRSNYETFARNIRKWKADLDNSKNTFSEAKTTKSNEFHKLKTDLGLHVNEFGLPVPVDDYD